jgi:hypothetical protein
MFGLNCTDNPCPIAPANDDCGDATLVPSFPATFNSNSENATSDCPTFAWPGEVWYVFTINEVCNLVIDYCGTVPAISQIGIALVQECPCGPAWLGATTWDWGATCADGENPTLWWENLAPGTYYYGVYVDDVQGHAYTINFDCAPPPTGRCCYNFPVECAVNVEAECVALAGVWTEGLDCGTPCPPPSYCTSTYTNCPSPDDWITNVTFNTINNTSGDECATQHYGDYTGISTTVTTGTTYTLSVTFYSEGIWTEHVRAWFDWNGNFAFEAGESFYLGSGIDATLTTNVLVPVDAVIGSTRLRVIEQYSTDPTSPCDPHATSYGETEDYTIIVQ